MTACRASDSASAAAPFAGVSQASVVMTAAVTTTVAMASGAGWLEAEFTVVTIDEDICINCLWVELPLIYPYVPKNAC